MKSCEVHGKKQNVDKFCDECGAKLKENQDPHKCRVCQKDLFNKRYCWKCGWDSTVKKIPLLKRLFH